MADPLKRPGVLLVGHGTRDVKGVEEFLVAARMLAERLPERVAPGFLELAQPAIADGVKQLLAGGVEQIVVMPLLLFSAGHAKRDVPEAVARALVDHPHVQVTQASHLGCQDDLFRLSHLRFREAIAGVDMDRRQRTTLVFVGRGSLDEEATAEMHEFARRSPQSAEVDRVEVCFWAMAKPALADMLDRVAASDAERVIVHPHFLFQGQLLDAFGRAVAERAAKSPHIEWLVTGRLGPHPLLIEALLHRLQEADPTWVEHG